MTTSDRIDLDATLRLADAVLEALQEHGADAVLIGALALAVHGYPRQTADLDLAVAVGPNELRKVAETLAARGFEVRLRDAGPDDPLGGVLDVRSPGADLVQVVNFDNPPSGGFPRLVLDSLTTASQPIAGSRLRVVDVYHLVAFKLYAGGAKSALDILELLERNSDIDVERLRGLCRRYRLTRDLNRVLKLTKNL